MADELVPSLSESPAKTPEVFHRDSSPPRNQHGQMYCDHDNCRGMNQTFKRLGEWNKHMDRHERPYKCREAGCELNPGFTYSGGLLRHQREVHKINLLTKPPLFCPFPNCNRSSGTGFTRKENLELHKKRRHLEELCEAASQPLLVAASSATSPEPPAKRRIVAQSMESLVESTENQVIQHLREEIRQKEEYIRRQATEIHRLHNLLRSLPLQANCHTQSQMPGAGACF